MNHVYKFTTYVYTHTYVCVCVHVYNEFVHMIHACNIFTVPCMQFHCPIYAIYTHTHTTSLLYILCMYTHIYTNSLYSICINTYIHICYNIYTIYIHTLIYKFIILCILHIHTHVQIQYTIYTKYIHTNIYKVIILYIYTHIYANALYYIYIRNKQLQKIYTIYAIYIHTHIYTNSLYIYIQIHYAYIYVPTHTGWILCGNTRQTLGRSADHRSTNMHTHMHTCATCIHAQYINICTHHINTYITYQYILALYAYIHYISIFTQTQAADSMWDCATKSVAYC